MKTTQIFELEEDFEDAEEDFEYINFRYLELIQEVDDARKNLEDLEKEVQEFYEDNREFIL